MAPAPSGQSRPRGCSPGVYLEDLCFDAQHAAEKAIKAVFVARGEPSPRGPERPPAALREVVALR